MPRVSAEADSVSAMRITRKAIGTVSIFDIGWQRTQLFAMASQNAPRVRMDCPQQLHIPGQHREKAEESLPRS